ncbi:MAG: hypothetical protein Q9196_005048 [Gyalolechia fulgens]
MGDHGLAQHKPPSAPVNPKSFFKSLFKIWRPPVTNSGLPGPLKLALAVSGGGDSMALATLCNQIRQYGDQFPELRDIRFQAFVVDHKARPESTREAEQVVDFVDKTLVGVLGLNKGTKMKTRILHLQWPPGVNPSELPNFETEARRLRYQALGKACYRANIPSLLLGHHEADVRETLIMRLIRGYRGEGLRGISEEADVPDCHGVYGASQSGGRDYTVTWGEKQMIKARDEEGMQQVLPPIHEYRQPGFEYGGVRIFRPLMDYDKPALEATLEKARVPWVTDPTNNDPTLSIRNAIRYLLQQNLLPKALGNGRSSALNIAANNMRRKFLHRNEQADELFQACDVISFNAQSGCLKIRIPLSAAPPSDPNFYVQSAAQQEIEVEHIGARLVRLLFSIVAPLDHLSLQTLELATETMLRHFQKDSYAPGQGTDESKLQSEIFTAGGVHCQRVKSPAEELSPPGAQPVVLDPDYVWCLSRSPYVTTLPEPVCIFPPAQPLKQKNGVENGDEETDEAQIGRGGEEGDEGRHREKGGVNSPEMLWQLWDGRYWIQVVNPLDKPVRIYPLSKDRLARLKAHLKANRFTKSLTLLQNTFHALGRPHIRHTLPAIMDDEDNCLALPTLDFRVPSPRSENSTGEATALKWRVRFKRVIFPDRASKDRIAALKDEKLAGVRPAFPRVAQEEEREKPRAQKNLEKREQKRTARVEERKRKAKEEGKKRQAIAEERNRAAKRRGVISSAFTRELRIDDGRISLARAR